MILIEGCAVATMDAAGSEHAAGPAVRRVDGSGCLLTPGLVNCHHHLYQWLTRGLAQQADLFGWLTELYPAWAAWTPPPSASWPGSGHGR